MVHKCKTSSALLLGESLSLESEPPSEYTQQNEIGVTNFSSHLILLHVEKEYLSRPGQPDGHFLHSEARTKTKPLRRHGLGPSQGGIPDSPSTFDAVLQEFQPECLLLRS